MKITILNGNPNEATPAFDDYLQTLQMAWESTGHQVQAYRLREMKIHGCIGCFGCWVKTPGECTSQDATDQIRRSVIHSDFVLMASPLCMGFPSALLKQVNEKFLPLLHPYIEMEHGEMHHKRRYLRYPKMGLLAAEESGGSLEDFSIVVEIYERIARNFKTNLMFARLTSSPVMEVANELGHL
jgi:multimeric flavodoxin WrbA